MNEKPTYELDKILSSVEPEHFNRYRNEEDTDSQMSVSEFFNRYKDYFLTLSRCGLHSILINSINNFMSEHFTNPKNYSEYRLYCYSGGLLNTFLKWEENGCDCDAGEIARTLEELYS